MKEARTDLLKEAQKIVESKFVWKRFIDGTPLANDIACWMAEFAQQHTSPPKREPEPEPVADPEKHPQFYTWTWDEWVSGGKWHAEFGWKKPKNKATNLQPLYTSPPKREWQGLTDDEIKQIEETTTCVGNESWLRNLTRNIEAKLKEKNT